MKKNTRKHSLVNSSDIAKKGVEDCPASRFITQATIAGESVLKKIETEKEEIDAEKRSMVSGYSFTFSLFL